MGVLLRHVVLGIRCGREVGDVVGVNGRVGGRVKVWVRFRVLCMGVGGGYVVGVNWSVRSDKGLGGGMWIGVDVNVGVGGRVRVWVRCRVLCMGVDGLLWMGVWGVGGKAVYL